MEITEDRFLGGRVIAAQPKRGFRAGHDTVLLAAAVPAKAGDHVLELGSGAGIASLCLAARVPDCFVNGFEVDPKLVALANANAKRNAVAGRVSFKQVDIFAVHMIGRGPQHVFLNPPFHPDTGQLSPSDERDRAKRGDVTAWMRVALGFSGARTITAIVRADRVQEIADQVEYVRVTVLPLAPRADESPKRAIVQVHRDHIMHRRLPALVLHEADGRPTAEAEAVLRHAAPVSME
jgi:tRNA1(Val) A37 N6-methylase TrmN6